MLKDCTCRKCGTRIRFIEKFAFCAITGAPHRCEPKVKIYTEEEKRKLEEEYRKGENGHKIGKRR